MRASTYHGPRLVHVFGAVTVASFGVPTWALVRLVAPVIGEHRPGWPVERLGGWLTASFMVMAFGLAWSTLLTIFFDRSRVRTDADADLPLDGTGIGSAVARVAALLGAVAACVDVGSGATLMVTFGIAALLALFAAPPVVRTTRALQAYRADLARITRLHADGTRVRADVVAVRFLDHWFHQQPQFDVTAEYPTPSGRRRVTRRLGTDPEKAPIVGGTVLLWYLHDGSDTDNVDMRHDERSRRDPEATYRYRMPTIH